MKRGRKSLTEKVQTENKQAKRRLSITTAQPMLMRQGVIVPNKPKMRKGTKIRLVSGMYSGSTGVVTLLRRDLVTFRSDTSKMLHTTRRECCEVI